VDESTPRPRASTDQKGARDVPRSRAWEPAACRRFRGARARAGTHASRSLPEPSASARASRLHAHRHAGQSLLSSRAHCWCPFESACPRTHRPADRTPGTRAGSSSSCRCSTSRLAPGSRSSACRHLCFCSTSDRRRSTAHRRSRRRRRASSRRSPGRGAPCRRRAPSKPSSLLSPHTAA
jgi:hypothetical protein